MMTEIEKRERDLSKLGLKKTKIVGKWFRQFLTREARFPRNEAQIIYTKLGNRAKGIRSGSIGFRPGFRHKNGVCPYPPDPLRFAGSQLVPPKSQSLQFIHQKTVFKVVDIYLFFYVNNFQKSIYLLFQVYLVLFNVYNFIQKKNYFLPFVKIYCWKDLKQPLF